MSWQPQDHSLPADYNPVDYDEFGGIKAVRRMTLLEKCKAEPLVPLGE